MKCSSFLSPWIAYFGVSSWWISLLHYWWYKPSIHKIYTQLLKPILIKIVQDQLYRVKCWNICIYIYLNIGAVYEFLKIFQSDNIMINVTTNLKKPMKAMRRQAVWTNASATIQAAYVLLILLWFLMNWTPHKEFFSV